MQRATDHNATFDYARLVAVVGIIWFHAGAPGALIGYSGLSFFLILLVCNAFPQISSVRPQFHRAPAWTRYAVARAQRLLLPWLIASLFYSGFKLVEVARGAPWGAEFTSQMWLTGAALHLWFLPFAFLVSVALWPLGRWFQDMLENTRSGLGISCGGLAILSLSFVQTQTLPVPFAQWAYALPVVFVGVTFATAQKNMTRTLAFLAFIVIGSLAIDATNGLLELTIAGAAMMACGFFRLAPTLLSAWCGRMSLWIYLAHPAVMTMLVRGANIPEGSVVLAVLTAAVTLAIVAVAETLTSSRLLGNALNP